MGKTRTGPKLFTCPKCRKAYLGHDPLPDCPACGFDYREREGFRWDVLVYLLSILGLISFLLVSSSYRSFVSETLSSETSRADHDNVEKLPGRERAATFPTPYHDTSR
ncbi:MAG: hypothetical protein Q8L74_14555 [Nitrospirota bacterium]|nr:hypothetical protein [Nitrospirota bacterium]MDP2383435.1 hypothetical protein [Nitrospirota bacterium]MDP3596553.1 hypothetical protein [Nitrospirota bacterium]